MNRPLIFEDYNYSKASTQFPLIEPSSTDKEVEDTAWQYTFDLLSRDSGCLQDAFIGEYFKSCDMVDQYHQKVLLAVVEQNYKEVGMLVECAIGAFNQIAIDYINEHIAQLEIRYE